MLVTGTKTLLPELIWSQSQTRRQVLDCRTSAGEVIINLPPIDDVIAINAEGVIFVINDYDNDAGTNSITVNAVNGDEIDIEGTDSVVISDNGASIVLGIGTEGKWIALESTSQGGGGGTGALYRAVIQLVSDGEQMTNTILSNNFPNGAPIINQLSGGISEVVFNGIDPVPNNFKTQGMFYENIGRFYWRSFFRDNVSQMRYYQQTSANGENGWVEADYTKPEGVRLNMIVIFEYYDVV